MGLFCFSQEKRGSVHYRMKVLYRTNIGKLFFVTF
jgi:hypothetical protein